MISWERGKGLRDNGTETVVRGKETSIYNGEGMSEKCVSNTQKLREMKRDSDIRGPLSFSL